MKLNVRLILILATAIAAVTFLVTFNAERTEKQGLRSDFARRAETLAEGFQETVEPYVRSGATPQLMRSMERFGNREHLIGIAVLDASGNPVAQTSEFNGMLDQAFSVFESAKSENRSLGTFKNTGMSEQYIYALPLHRNSGEDSMLVLVFDASEINARSLQIWRDA